MANFELAKPASLTKEMTGNIGLPAGGATRFFFQRLQLKSRD